MFLLRRQSDDVIVTCLIKSVQELERAVLKDVEFNGKQEKNIHYLCEDWTEKSAQSLGKPRDAKR